MIHAASAKLVADFIGGSQTKIGDGDTEAIVEAEDVLGFEIPMINTQRVAVFHGVKHLQEDVLDESVVSEIPAIVEDLREEVVVGSVIHDNIRAVVLLDDAMEGDNAWMGGCELVEGDLADVDLALARYLMTGRDQALHGVLLAGIAHIDSAVDHTVSAHAKYFFQHEGISVNESSDWRVNGGSLGSHERGTREKAKAEEGDEKKESAPVRTETGGWRVRM